MDVMALCKKVLPRLRSFDLRQTAQRSAIEDMATLLARAWPDIYDPVGASDHVELMFDDEQRVSRNLEPVERPQKCFRVRRVQTCRGFVQDLDDAEQIGSHLGREPQPLQFSGRQCGGAALQGQVSQPEVEKNRKAHQQVLCDPLNDNCLFRMQCVAIGAARPPGKRSEQLTQVLERKP